MKQYTAEDVQNILTGFAEEFIVDIPALHNEDGYFIEHNQLAGSLILADPEWFGAVAGYVDDKLALGE